MTQKYLMYYNHDEEGVPSAKAIKQACSSLRLEPVRIRAGWTTSCQVGVIHGKAIGLEGEIDYYDELSQEDVASADGLPVIFVSSVPANRPVKKVHFRRADGTRGVRYLLPIRRTIESGLTTRNVEDEPDEDLVNRWVSLLEAVTTPGVLEEWFKAPGSAGVNSILDKMLLEPTAPESLIALLVLCQGYLAVHTFHHKGEYQSEEIKDALRDSGVENAVKDTALVVPQLATVSNADWWQKVFDVPESELKLLVAREWGTSDIEQCPKAVKDLIAAIFAGPVGPQVVAEGCLAIATRLRTA